MDKTVLNETLKYAVKLSVGNDEGSGVIHFPEDGYIYIFTCLHCLEGLLGNDRETIAIEIGYHDRENFRTLPLLYYKDIEFLSFAGDKHAQITAKYEGNKLDYAVLRTKLDSPPFHEAGKKDIKLPKLKIWPKNVSLNKGMCLYGNGYPNDSKVPKDLTSEYNVKNDDLHNVHCTITYDGEFNNMMHGFSGCAQFASHDSNGLCLVGLTTSGDIGERHEYFDLVNLYALLEKMKEFGWPVPEIAGSEAIPTSFLEKSIWGKLCDDLDEIPDRNATDNKRHLRAEFAKFAQNNNPASYLSKHNILEINRCDESRKACSDFWYGTFWLSLLQDALKDSEYKDINMEYICSEGTARKRIESLVHELITSGLVINQIPDGTILLWQSREIPKIGVAEYTTVSNILGDYVDDHLDELPQGEDVVWGLISDRKYALLHRNELLTVISKTDNWDKAKEAMRGAVRDVWR